VENCPVFLLIGGPILRARNTVSQGFFSASALSGEELEQKARKRLTVTIDGPSGAGKSTVAKGLAKQLGYVYIDTGAMYRAVALEAKERGKEFEDEGALYQWASSLMIAFLDRGGEIRILCNGRDVTREIRSPEVSLLASEISKRKGVREALVQMQREMGEGGGVVLEGRDTGTVVFPRADVKFYLDAKPEERARRRFEELAGRGVNVDFRETFQEVIQRDQNDMNRSLSPLRRAEEAVLIDSTCRSAEEVIDEMVLLIQEIGLRKGDETS
jgi:cytidylate kinase